MDDKCVLNPASGRLVKTSGAIGKKLQRAMGVVPVKKVKKERVYKEGVLNPATGRMVSPNGALGRRLQKAMGIDVPTQKRGPKPKNKSAVVSGSIRNPATGRMVKLSSPAGKSIAEFGYVKVSMKSLGRPPAKKQLTRAEKIVKGKKILDKVIKEKKQKAPKTQTPKTQFSQRKPRVKKETAMTYDGAVRQLKTRIERAKYPKKKAQLQAQLDMMLAS